MRSNLNKNWNIFRITGSVDDDTKPDMGAIEVDPEYKIILKWRNIIAFIYLHIFTLYAIYDPPHMQSTYVIQFVLLVAIGYGTTVGSHRLFTHRTYRATTFLKSALLVLQTMSGQEVSLPSSTQEFWILLNIIASLSFDGWEIIESIINSPTPMLIRTTRSAAFSSVTWAGWCVKSIPTSSSMARKLTWATWRTTPFSSSKRSELNSQESDKPFKKSFVIRVYTPASFILAFVIPVTIHYYLGEDPFRALNWNILRYTFGLHMVWLVNSGAHKWGMRPYDK